ncbi:MAG: biopolymer transporter ExbD [Alphaproteobacteria bacterium]|nr:biopolymer transporter ExbD [Alphaproteobacteria bacterium]
MRLSDWQRRKSTIGLTPLIDVVFLLLIFFMLASTFLKFSALPVSGARGGGVSGNLSEIALIQLRGLDDIRVNNVGVRLDGLQDRIAALVEKGVTRAVLQPAEGAKVQDLVKALEITRKTALKSVVVVR